MKRTLLCAFVIAASSASAQPTYKQAWDFRATMSTLISQSKLQLKKPEGFRQFSEEVEKLEPAALKLFGKRASAGDFEACIAAAASVRNYWQSQMSALNTTDPLLVGFTASAGFELGQNYGRCSDQIDMLDRLPPGPPRKKVP